MYCLIWHLQHRAIATAVHDAYNSNYAVEVYSYIAMFMMLC